MNHNSPLTKDTIKRKLITYVISVLAFAFTIGALVNFYMINTKINQSVKQDIVFVGKYIKGKFKSEVKHISADLKHISASRNIEEYDTNFQSKMVVKEFLKHSDEFDILSFLDENNKIIVKVINGKVSKKSCDRKTIKLRDDLIKQAKKTPNEVIFSDTVYCKNFKKPSILFAIAKDNYSNKGLKTIIGVVTIDKFLNKDDFILQDKYLFRVVNQENQIVFSSLNQEILKQFNSERGLVNNRIYTDLIMGKKSYVYTLNIGQSKVVVSLDYGYYYALLFDYLKLAIVGLLGVFILSIIVIRIISKNITDPLKNLIKKMEYFSENDFTKKIENGSKYYEVHTLTTIFNKLGKELQDERKEIIELNNTLNQRVKDEVEKNQAQERRLVQQSKTAAMGEMMDAIAHQWKQPINAIKVGISSIKMQSNLGLLNNKYSLEVVETVSEQVNELIETIDEFRKFFRPNQEREVVNIKESIEYVKTLMKNTLLKDKIEVEINGDTTLEYKLIPTEFKHVFINLINNTKDAFDEQNIDDKKIIFDIFKEGEFLKITVTDNAGGIKEDVIRDIFKANITTKPKGVGTGIGLYLTTQIIEKLQGTIKVENVTYQDEENKTQKGARFIITLPPNL